MSTRPRRPADTSMQPTDAHARRLAALGDLQRLYAPTSSDLLPRDAVDDVVAAVRAKVAEQQVLAKARVIDGAGDGRRAAARGMHSVWLDGFQTLTYGAYYERPGPLSFDALRTMVEQTPVLSAVILTRIRQVQRFCQPQDGGDGPGFQINYVDPLHDLTTADQRTQAALTQCLMNCGTELDVRQRRRLRRDSFSQCVAKLTRESLVYDAAAIETERRRNGTLDGFYALDGSTIRLCTEQGYQGDDAVIALQVVAGRICTAYTIEDLIYEPRNPRADVRLAGYGMGETEILIRVVTGFLNAMAYNAAGFDNNAIPKGMLHLIGQYDERDLANFKRQWNGMVKGVNNAFALPVMTTTDPNSKVSFEAIGSQHDEMAFAKWMTFLVSIICAVYGMSPSEINFDSFTGGSTSALAGSDTAEKLAASKDSGLRPLLSYLEGVFSNFLIDDPRWVFRWTGLDPKDAARTQALRMATLTVNEIRAQEGWAALDGPLGEAPVNPALIGPWMQLQQGGETPDDAPDQPAPGGPDDADAGDDADQAGGPAGGDQADAQAGQADEGEADARDGGRLAKANPYHDAAGQFSRSPQIRYEKRQLHELYDFTLKHPVAAPDAMLVRLQADDLAVQLDKGPAVESADGQIKVTGRRFVGRGYGMVKVLWKHGRRSNKPRDEQVTRGDVLALPEVVRGQPTAVTVDGQGRPVAWEWQRRRFDGKTAVYAASRFTATDDRNHIVTIHIEPSPSTMKKAAVYAAGDLCGRTPQLPDDGLLLTASSVGPLTIHYCPEPADVKAPPTLGADPAVVWRVEA